MRLIIQGVNYPFPSPEKLNLDEASIFQRNGIEDPFGFMMERDVTALRDPRFLRSCVEIVKRRAGEQFDIASFGELTLEDFGIEPEDGDGADPPPKATSGKSATRRASSGRRSSSSGSTSSRKTSAG